MRRSLYEADHEAFRDTMRAWIDRALRPNAARHATEHRIDRDCWREAGRAGLANLCRDRR